MNAPGARPDLSLADVVSVMEAVDVPLLLLSATPATVRAANGAARSILERGTGVSLPCPLSGLADMPTTVALGLYLDGTLPPGNAPRLPVCLLVGSQRRQFSGRLAVLSGNDGLWMLTLDEQTHQGFGQPELLKILDDLPIGVEVYDRQLRQVFFNRVSDALFAYDEALIVDFDDWWQYGFPDEAQREAARREWQDGIDRIHAAPHSTVITQWEVRCRDGATRVLQCRYKWIEPYYVLLITDVTGERRLERQLRILATSDPLTGLWNRRHFWEQAEQALASAHQLGKPLALLLMDIDHFKQVNDTHGHGVGDEVLRALSAQLREGLPDGAILARVGGEEFALLLPGASPAQAEAHALRLLERLAGEDIVPGVRSGMSIGLAAPEADSEALTQLLARADHALYQAKAEGRGRVRVAPAGAGHPSRPGRDARH
jgi:diguanylate cyclase (GGDEF)-like protein